MVPVQMIIRHQLRGFVCLSKNHLYQAQLNKAKFGKAKACLVAKII